MNVLWRIVRFLFRLLYRLIVLVLYERWIPFDESPAEPLPAPKRKDKKKRKVQPPHATAPRKQRERAYREREFFEVQSIEPPPELASRMEGEHMKTPRRRPPPRPPRKEQSLRAMLQDKRAIRDAMIVGAVFAPRHRK